MFFQFARIVQGVIREQVFKPFLRSGEWSTVRKRYLDKHPTCMACGSRLLLNVHHIKPYHLEPHLELDESNLITLCMKNLCHLEIGHAGSFSEYNPDVKEDAMKYYNMHYLQRKLFLQSIKKKAKII